MLSMLEAVVSYWRDLVVWGTAPRDDPTPEGVDDNRVEECVGAI